MTSETRLPLLAALLAAFSLACSSKEGTADPVVPAMTGAPTLSATAVVEGTQLTLTVPVNSTARRVAVYLGSDLQVTGEQVSAGVITGNEAGEGVISGSVLVPTGAVGSWMVGLAVTDAAGTTGTTYLADSAVSATEYVAVDLATDSPADSEIPLAQVTVVPSGPPNLVVNIWPGDEIAGEIFVLYTVTNVGGGIAGPFTVGFFNAPTTLPGVGASPDLRVEVPSLPAGASAEGITSITSIPGSSSNGYVYAYADLFDTIAETDETDNLVAPPAAPEMTGAPTVSPNPVEGGMELTVSIPVNASVLRAGCELGWGTGPSWRLGTVGWAFGLTWPLEPFEGRPSSSGVLTGTFRVPASISGSFPVSCWVDNDALAVVSRYEHSSCLIAEDWFSTTHYALYWNCNYTLATVSGVPITFVTIAPSATPNLTVTIDSVTPAGTGIDLAYTVRNAGGAAAGPSTVGFFADPAAVPTLGATADFSVDVASLAAFGAVSGVATLSGGAMTSVYALADVANAVAEFDETDNLASLVPSRATPVPTGPPVVSPNPVEEGTPLTVTVPVNATARRVRVILSQASVASRHFDAGVLTGNFAGEGYISGTVTVPIGANGENYVWITVLDEAETNGTACHPDPVLSTNYHCWRMDGGGNLAPEIPATAVTILPSARPNLVATIGAVTPGSGTVDLTVTVRNVGGGAAGPSVLGLFADRTAVPAIGATPDLSTAMPALAAGASASATFTVPATSFVGAFADLGGVVSEFIEGDNLASWLAPATSFSSGTPVAFPRGGTATSTIVVSGAPSALALVTVTLDDVFYSLAPMELRPPDVEVTLTSPSGTTVSLVADVPLEQGNYFRNTVLSDWAAASLADGVSSFFGSVRPTQPLATFAGEDANGDWTLTVRDVGTTPDTGTITAWSLRLW